MSCGANNGSPYALSRNRTKTAQQNNKPKDNGDENKEEETQNKNFEVELQNLRWLERKWGPIASTLCAQGPKANSTQTTEQSGGKEDYAIEPKKAGEEKKHRINED